MVRQRIAASALVLGLFVASAGLASAATCGSGLSGVGNFVEGQIDCVTGDTVGTGGGGNPLDSYVNLFGLGKTWNVLDTTNLGQPQAEGNDTLLQFSGFSVQPDDGGTVGGAGTTGTWSISAWPANTLLAFALKGGSERSGGGVTFHLMGTSLLSGDWYMNPAGLSNFRVFAAAGDNGPGPDLDPVPLPAAGWMLLAALGGLAVWRRRAAV